MSETGDTQRIDRWLWYARFFKSRSLATRLCAGSRVRVNRQIVSKASSGVRVGDVLTFPQGPHIRVVKVLALGSRRGPAPEAQELYEDLSPPKKQQEGDPTPQTGGRERGSGRPTKRDRRQLDRLRDEPA